MNWVAKILLFISFLWPMVTGADYETLLSRYDWPEPVSVEAVLGIPQLRRAVNELDRSADVKLIIRYPGGDSGNDLAIQIRNSLISLGVPAAVIVIEPASGEPDSVRIVVQASRTSS